VEQNSLFFATQATSWGLDRIDQRELPLDDEYRHDWTGRGVQVYVIDTGIHETHVEFAGRIGSGFGAIDDGWGTGDCSGHGTHVGGIVGGTTYGVAKEVTLHPVRVLDCEGTGTTDQVVAGVEWVTANHIKPAVANMSLAGAASPALDEAIRRSIAAGVFYSVVATNESADACDFSPSRLSEAITVGATSRSDEKSSFSNWGPCVDIFAPGEEIVSASNGSDSDLAIMSDPS
jgi:subtilisin family serine protease